MRSILTRSIAAATLLLPQALAAQNTPARWFIAEMRQLVTEPDVWWVADNTPFRGPGEPFVRYAVRWTAEDDGWTVSGRLVAVDTAGAVLPMWTYRMYWHPGEQQGYLMQTSSWGAYAIGPMRLDTTASNRTIVNDQDLWQPGSTASRTRHRSWFADDHTQATESLTWLDGSWKPGRTYRWVRGRLETTAPE